jgi:hypothetical protein
LILLDWLTDLLDNFEFIFWMIIVFGSSVASFFKKRKPKGEARPPKAPPVAPAIPLTVEEIISKPPPEAFSDSFPLEVPSQEAIPLPTTLEEELRDKKLGTMQATGPVLGIKAKSWRPHTTWREAIILREILGPPRALSDNDIPGLRL